MIDEQDFLHEIQEQDGGFESGATNRLPLLHLSPEAHAPLHCSTTGIPSKTTSGGGLLEKCTNCCGGSTKRQPPPSLQEPSPKRATLHSASTNYHFPGFTKLPLPNPLPSLIRRTTSEPIYTSDAMNAAQFSGFSAGHDSILNPQLEEGSKSNAVQETAPPLVGAPPHVPACLYRTTSDPTPAVNYEAVTTTTPPRPPAARKYSRSPSRRESPNTKRLNKMRERLKEMNQWWNQVLHESEEGKHEDSGSEDNNTENNLRDESETEIEEPAEEAVWVERKGEFLVLHFRCPCGKGYQILLRGSNCYYKLTSF